MARPRNHLPGLFAALVALWASSASLTAQPYLGDYFIAENSWLPSTSWGTVYRLTKKGQIASVLAQANKIQWITGGPVMDTTNRQVIFLANNLGCFAQGHDAKTGAFLWSVPLPASVYFAGLIPSHTGGYIASGMTWPSYGPGLWSGSADLRTWSTLAQLPSGLGQPAIARIQDLLSGDYVATNLSQLSPSQLALSIFKVSPDGRNVSLLTSLSIAGYGGGGLVQSHLDGSFLLIGGAGQGRFGVLRYGGQGKWTTLAAGLYDSAVAFDRSPGNGILTVVGGASGRALQRLDSTGRVVSSYPIAISYATAGMIHERDRNLSTARVSPRNQWDLHMSFPGESGRRYILGLSYTGFTPGVPVGSRLVPLRPDSATWLSVTGRLAPFLVNNIGSLNAAGEATSRLDLGAFGKMVSGLRLWASAVTLDSNSPSGMATISKPVVLVLD